MDFKPEKYRKGELVRYSNYDNTLGIVVGQDGSKVTVQWVSWPGHPELSGQRDAVGMYRVERVEGQV